MTALALIVACACSLAAGAGMAATLACIQDGLSAAARHRGATIAFWLTTMVPAAFLGARPFMPWAAWDAPHAAVTAILPIGLPTQSWLATVAEALAAALLLLALAGGLRLAAGLRTTGRLAKAARMASPNGEPVRLADVPGPMLLGLRHPTVILPEATRDYPPAVVDALVRHERAHARRRDNWRLCAESWAIALLPWCWPLRRLHHIVLAAREELCDAEALRGTDDATRTGYGRALVDALRRSARAHAGASTAAGHREALRRRMAAVLDPARPCPPPPWRVRFVAVMMLAMGWMAAASTWSLNTELETIAGLRGITLHFRSLAGAAPDIYRVSAMGGPSTGHPFAPGTYRVTFRHLASGEWDVRTQSVRAD